MCRVSEQRSSALSTEIDMFRAHSGLGTEDMAVPSQVTELIGKVSRDMPNVGMDSPASHTDALSINWVEGAIIVGAGPSGLATAASLQKRGVPSIILEREDCIGSLWRYRTYNRLRLHIAKQFCELPHLPFPASFPTFPTRAQFLEYLDEYARTFNIRPHFNECVQEATYCAGARLWRVVSKGPSGVRTFVGRWLIAATGENAQPKWPEVPGLDSFHGKLIHSSEYKCGEEFCGKRVLVVGGGNSGLEVALDLADHQAHVSISVRSQVHVLPREILGLSTFSLAMTLLKYLSLRWTDRLLLFASRLILGETSQLGFPRPAIGPMEMKSSTGKTPSLDAGTLSRIRNGSIKVLQEVQEFNSYGCTFVNGSDHLLFDAVILATGFKSNVPSWLKERGFFSEEGLPNNWKGSKGLYLAGFTRKGLLGVCMDAQRIAEDISKVYSVHNWRML